MPPHGTELTRKWCAWCLTWTDMPGGQASAFLALVLWNQEHYDGACVGADLNDPSELALRKKAGQDCEGGDCGRLGVECGPCLAAGKLRARKAARA